MRCVHGLSSVTFHRDGSHSREYEQSTVDDGGTVVAQTAVAIEQAVVVRIDLPSFGFSVVDRVSKDSWVLDTHRLRSNRSGLTRVAK